MGGERGLALWERGGCRRLHGDTVEEFETRVRGSVRTSGR